jgi:AraC-like DNA-binding protein
MLHADPGTAKVGEIARNHNFTASSRFAAMYREAFGETPSVTLRRVRHATAAGDAPFVYPLINQSPPLTPSAKSMQNRL